MYETRSDCHDGIMKKAVFLDRDGVINQTVFRLGKPRAPYTLEEFSFLPGVPEAVDFLKDEGFLIVVVTNQPDVARGWVSRDAVDLVNNYVKNTLNVLEIRSCFHTEHDACDCRKPAPGMLIEASKTHGIDLKQSFMVGDRMSDIEAGKRAGCQTILIGEGETGEQKVIPDHQATSLLIASGWIVQK